MRVLRTLGALACLAVVLGAQPAVARATEDTSPRLRLSECPVDLQTTRRVDCYTLQVPQVRGDPSYGNVKVQVAIARARHPLADPIVFFMGGPDYPGVDGFSTFYLGGKEYSADRDWIMFDARGIGNSRPYLGCPELDAQAAAAYPEDPGYGGVVHKRSLIKAHLACRTRLQAEGVALRSYGATDVALDIIDLRNLLGIHSWNVVAFSAGGESALELMRLDPAPIRSVILDSIVTRAYEPSFDYWMYGHTQMDKAFRGCAAQPDCAAAYPNLRNRFYDEVRRLNAHPFLAQIAVEGGGSITWTIDGGFLLEEGAYINDQPQDVALWPSIADGLTRDDDVRHYVSELVQTPPQPLNDFIAVGRTFAARCRAEFNFQTPATLAAAKRRSPWMASNFTYDFDMRICQAWDVGRTDPAAHGYLSSDLAVLTLHGEWDTAPADNGRILAQARHFPNGWAFTFPNHGHGQTLDGPTTDGSCARSIAAQFIAQPDVQPNSSCIALMEPIVFNVGDESQAFRAPARSAPLEWPSAMRP